MNKVKSKWQEAKIVNGKIIKTYKVLIPRFIILYKMFSNATKKAESMGINTRIYEKCIEKSFGQVYYLILENELYNEEISYELAEKWLKEFIASIWSVGNSKKRLAYEFKVENWNLKLTKCSQKLYKAKEEKFNKHFLYNMIDEIMCTECKGIRTYYDFSKIMKESFLG